MSNLKIFFFALFLALGNVAMAQQVIFSNQSSNYFVAMFHTDAISGCNPASSTNYVYDIPDNLVGNVAPLEDENGNPANPLDVTGISIALFSTVTPVGVIPITIQAIDFCNTIPGVPIPINGTPNELT